MKPTRRTFFGTIGGLGSFLLFGKVKPVEVYRLTFGERLTYITEQDAVEQTWTRQFQSRIGGSLWSTIATGTHVRRLSPDPRMISTRTTIKGGWSSNDDNGNARCYFIANNRTDWWSVEK